MEAIVYQAFGDILRLDACSSISAFRCGINMLLGVQTPLSKQSLQHTNLRNTNKRTLMHMFCTHHCAICRVIC